MKKKYAVGFRGFCRQVSAKKQLLGALTIALLSGLVVLSSTLVYIPRVSRAASPSDFDNYQILTIDHTQVPSDLTNFPVLVYNSSWVTGLNATSFTFFASDQSTELNWELEEYNSSSGKLVAWVNVTSVSSTTNTTFYLYYDSSNSSDGGEHNPTQTWDADYVAVFHAGNLNDSTSNGYVLTNHGADIVSSGMVGSCFDIEADEGDFLDNTSFYDLSSLSDVTIEAFFNIESVSDDGSNRYGGIRFGDVDDTGNNGFVFRYRTSSDPHFQTYAYTPKGTTEKGLETSTSYSTGIWYYVVGVYISSSHTVKIYLNGTSESGDEHTVGSGEFDFSTITNDSISIGKHRTDRIFDGKIDEIRVSKIERSSSWLQATYNNLHNKTSFVLFGQNQTAGEGTYEIAGLDASNRFPFSGEAGDTVWSTGNVTMKIYTNLSGTSDNCTDIFIDFADVDSDIVQENFSIAVINSADGSWNDITSTFQVPASDGNVTLNASTWSTGVSSGWADGSNPFPIVNENVTIEVRCKVSIPSGKSPGTYTSDSMFVKWKVIT